MLSSTELMEMPKASEIKFIFVCGSGVGCGDCGDGREHKKSTLNSFFFILFRYLLYLWTVQTSPRHLSKAWWQFSMMKILHKKNHFDG